MNELDRSALDALHRLADALDQAGIDLCLAEAKSQVTKRLERDGLLERLGEERVFVSTSAAVDDLEDRYRPNPS